MSPRKKPAQPQTPADKLSDYERGIIAGVLITAGTFSGDKTRGVLSMRTADRARAELMQKLMGGTVNGPYAASGHSSQVYTWLLGGPSLVQWTPFFEQHLIGDQLNKYTQWRAKYHSPGARATPPSQRD